ncbi:DegT/DnrJ/EryC1/StrS family aminotransferase [Hymenobacter sp. DH14]|uniref:DegT/DnrJ/EryC1/StrS family aminotransferase n=1 Tax=Hymenobacter cyanobacteriorum TaxID=2926463 RepID=A0A9X1VCF0_9BACT|nr:DegT/DnrJ/EryC1/StrS family aminotransferase [Hymenobacter cyanobacteriorum]MCI1185970.1 DegT/DnrJ/EryC1/StrS family aminotransferase [Hymenobacter cyanobacteriorum]
MILPVPPSPIQLLDLAAEHALLQPALNEAMQEVLESAAFIQGPAVGQFAAELGEYLGGTHVAPCANGTDALTLALMSLNLPDGAEVIVPAFTYVATLEAAALLGLRPVLADVHPDTFNLAPAAVESAITPRTGAIIAVHLFGQCADLEALRTISTQHGIPLIEDNAQAIGATFRFSSGEIVFAGAVGDVGTTSFFPSKNLGCLGDGGALLTRDSDRAALLHQLANHGQSRKYHHQRIGLNSRLDTLQAALLRVKLRQLPANTAARQAVAARYDAALATVPGLTIPARDPRSSHVFHQYTIRLADASRRDDLQGHLRRLGVPTMIYYPLPVHAQPAYAYLGHQAGQFPVAERLCGAVLSLPIHPLLTREQQEYITAGVQSFQALE